VSDPTAVPTLIVVTVIAIPVVVVVFLGVVAGRKLSDEPLSYRCLRCDREFRRRPHKRFPDACPLCHARDWSS
jgi:hypothetical protein